MHNLFECLGLPVTARVDRETLEAQYLELAKRWHPDRFVSSPSQEQAAAQRMAAQVNEAYRTLKDPVRRAEYLVKLGGIDLDSSDPETGAPAPSPAFLMEMLERRDAIEEGERDPEDVLDEVESELDESLRAATKALEAQDIKAAADYLVQHRYFQRLADELEPA